MLTSARNWVANVGLSDRALIPVDLALQPSNVIFATFAVFTRLIFEVVFSLFNRGQFPAEPPEPPLPFSPWE